MECKIEKISIKLAALQIITYESTNYLTIWLLFSGELCIDR